ncbi:glycosyltransferase family 4 protein [Cryobacterium sp. AP23]
MSPARMEIGGSQTNAVELARGVADLGHDVSLFGPDGPLISVVNDLGLDYTVAPDDQRWPSRRNITALTTLVRTRKTELVHGYEWGPTIDLAFGPHRLLGTPLVSTVLSMSVPDFLPRHCPLVVGTKELADQHARHFPRVVLIEPPVDTTRNAPRDVATARRRFGFRPEDLVLSVVGRLVTDLDKLSGVQDSIQAVDELAADYAVRMLVVGDGPGLADVRRHADTVNTRRGREVITVTGGLLDPRDAYAAADVVLGMGSSALKGLAFAKPLIVQGAAGFWCLLEPATLHRFLDEGWYGHDGAGIAALLTTLRPLLNDTRRRLELGAFGRDLVVERFSLARASRELADVYAAALAAPGSRAATYRGLTGSGIRLARFKFAMARHRAAAAITGAGRVPVPANGAGR